MIFTLHPHSRMTYFFQITQASRQNDPRNSRKRSRREFLQLSGVWCGSICQSFDFLLQMPSVLTNWLYRAASKDLELESTYIRLLKETSSHEKSITRDLGRCGAFYCSREDYWICWRTFPHHAFFTDGHGIGQENLFNVLKAYSLWVLSLRVLSISLPRLTTL